MQNTNFWHRPLSQLLAQAQVTPRLTQCLHSKPEVVSGHRLIISGAALPFAGLTYLPSNLPTPRVRIAWDMDALIPFVRHRQHELLGAWEELRLPAKKAWIVSHLKAMGKT